MPRRHVFTRRLLASAVVLAAATLPATARASEETDRLIQTYANVRESAYFCTEFTLTELQTYKLPKNDQTVKAVAAGCVQAMANLAEVRGQEQFSRDVKSTLVDNIARAVINAANH